MTANHDALDSDFFRTHGFFVWRGLLAPDEVGSLRREVVEALHDNYPIPEQALEEATGTEGYYLPMMCDRTPISRRLLADDRVMGAAARLLGGPVLPKPAKGILYRDASPWHQDSANTALRAIKVVAYLDPLDAGTGALQVLPGTHFGEYARSLDGFRDRWPVAEPIMDETVEAALWPGVPLESRPGDVIAFDVHLWHASLGGRDRLQWSASYAGAPVDDRERAAVRHYIASFLDVGHPYDIGRYPYFDPAWSRLPRPAFAEAMAQLFPDSIGAAETPMAAAVMSAETMDGDRA
jgi:hypothetical protein